MLKVLLLRHARTQSNARKAYLGLTNEPISAEGAAFAAGLHYDSERKVYVSPMKRAVQTAEICLPNAERVIVPEFREMDFGVFEGRSAADMSGDTEFTAWTEQNCEPAPPGGSESWTEYRDMVCCKFDRLVTEHLSRGDNRIAIVAHGGTIMAIMSRYAQPEKPYYMWNPRHRSGYELLVDTASNGDWKLESWESLKTE
ncbi:MAG: histidine phosphatase family protein [Oscillospiraceae bacterium]|jgi:alpha-ribazole phosphatase|nr:histidine phosphatase family protein [Oscillospiraceae bacterium]